MIRLGRASIRPPIVWDFESWQLVHKVAGILIALLSMPNNFAH